MEQPARPLTKKTDVRTSRKAQRLGKLASWAMRVWTATLRVEIDDRCGITSHPADGKPRIFLLWHSRIFALPPIWWRIAGKHRRQVILTSASKDGAIVETALAAFGMEAVRGSSHRRGAAAIVGLLRALKAGADACITPDGPKGPRYVMQPGLIKLAEASGCPIVPVHLVCPAAWRLPTWDKLVIPMPFSHVRIIIGEELAVPPSLDQTTFEATLARVQNTMLALTEDIDC